MNRPIYQVKKLTSLSPVRSRGREGAGTEQTIGPLSFSLESGEILTLLAEHDSRRTRLAALLSGLSAPDGGEVLLTSSSPVPSGQLPFSPGLRLVPPRPERFLSPTRTLAAHAEWPLERLGQPQGDLRRQCGLQALQQAGVPADWETKKASALTPPQLWRVGLAQALSTRPQVLICDNPFDRLTPLEAESQAAFLQGLAADLGLSLVVIAQDLPLAVRFSHRVGILCGGQLVEMAVGQEMIQKPLHPFTKLWADALSPAPQEGDCPGKWERQGSLHLVEEPPSGCIFRTRCPFAMGQCAQLTPALTSLSPTHQVACHLFG